MGSTFEHIQNWKKTQTQNKAQLWVCSLLCMNRGCTGLHKLKERCGKALTGISQMERSYGVITSVINLHDAQSITEDSARLCPHTLCLCMTPRGLWWRHSHGAADLGMGGGSTAQCIQHGMIRGVTKRIGMPRAQGRTETHAWQQHREGRGQKQRLKDHSLGVRGGRNKEQSKLGEQRRFFCKAVGCWAFIVISQHHQIFITFTSKTVC